MYLLTDPGEHQMVSLVLVYIVNYSSHTQHLAGTEMLLMERYKPFYYGDRHHFPLLLYYLTLNQQYRQL